jgi:ElaB/YqjD/DUF883 family membrane-anchored ribosome-binding protein
VSSSDDPEQIREEIEATRQELGDTVAALAQKADVKAQAKQKIEDAKASVSEKKDELFGKAREASPESASTAASEVTRKARDNPLPVAAAGAFVIGFLAGRISAR